MDLQHALATMSSFLPRVPYLTYQHVEPSFSCALATTTVKSVNVRILYLVCANGKEINLLHTVLSLDHHTSERIPFASWRP